MNETVLDLTLRDMLPRSEFILLGDNPIWRMTTNGSAINQLLTKEYRNEAGDSY